MPFAKKDNSLTLGKARFMEGWLAEWEIEKRLPKVLEKYRDRMGLAHAAVPQNPAPWADDLVLDAETLDFYKKTDWARFGPWDMIVPVQLKALLQEPDNIDEQTIERARKQVKEREQIEGRDEYKALEAAIPDLKRLDRYQRRAWSRQKRALREFMRIKLAATNCHSDPAEERSRYTERATAASRFGRTKPTNRANINLAERSQAEKAVLGFGGTKPGLGGAPGTYGGRSLL